MMITRLQHKYPPALAGGWTKVGLAYSWQDKSELGVGASFFTANFRSSHNGEYAMVHT